MPLYEFKDTETEEIFEVMMSFSEAEEFMEKHPQIKRYYSKAPGLLPGKRELHLRKLEMAGKKCRIKLKKVYRKGMQKIYEQNE